jgi:uncharacterized protein (TIGR02996 family)
MESGAILDELLALWRETRALELVPLVELASARAGAAREPVRARKTMQAAWLERAAQQAPADLAHLLDLLTKDTRSRELLGRLDALAAWPEDPRVVTALLAYLEKPAVVGPSGRKVVLRVLAILAAREDPRVLARLEAIVSGSVDLAEHRLRRIGRVAWQGVQATAAQLRARRPLGTSPLDAPRRRRAGELEALLTKPAPPARDGKALLADVHAALDDDRPRLVYADWLLESGDVRGELIVLQVQRAREGGKVTRRERELLSTWARRWLGPLEPLVQKQGLVYERGFLHACRLAAASVPNVDDEKVKDHPAWATLREVDVSGPATRMSWAQVKTWLQQCLALDRVTGANADDLSWLRWPLSALGLRHVFWSKPPQLDKLATVRELELKRYFNQPGATPQLLAPFTRALPQLERLVVDGVAWRRAGTGWEL